MGFRAKSTRVLGLAGMISLMACGGAENASNGTSHETTRSGLTTHKVQLTAEQAQQLEKSGAPVRVLNDYGSFKLVQVEEAALVTHDRALPQYGIRCIGVR